MDSAKAAIADRVAEQYKAAREKTHAETAQIWVRISVIMQFSRCFHAVFTVI